MYHFSDNFDESHWDGFNAPVEPSAGFRTMAGSMPRATTSHLPPMPQSPSGRSRPSSHQGSRRDLYQQELIPMSGSYQDGSFPPQGHVMTTRALPSAPPTYGYQGFAASQALEQARSKYHVPGYRGFVRGEQFRHGETYGRVTRRCLDVPVNLPLEP